MLSFLNFLFFVLALITLIFTKAWMASIKRILPLDKLPVFNHAIVLGAGLKRDGCPTDILSDRVLSGVRLIKAGKVKKLILSGSKKLHNYDETAAMLSLAAQSGIVETQIEIDDRGNSTFESLVNFKRNNPKENLVIITQNFHLPRAIWIARVLNIDTFGFAAHLYRFSRVKIFVWALREFIAVPFNLVKIFKYYYSIKNLIV
jgi:vancomycin permeability regulator SanA